jgi:8-oxo-dGTP diphosphatase
MKLVRVVAAVIQVECGVLCVQRGVNKHDYISQKWEFPGGKIEDNETAPQALAREIHEELLVEIIVGDHLTTIDHTYPDFRLVMDCYLCTPKSKGLPEVTLTEHLSLKWLEANSKEFIKLDWAAADLPIVDLLRDRAN